jgi:hypothetical protein
MVLIEVMTAAWTQYRQGLTYAIQHKDFDSCIIFIYAMVAMLPKDDRPKMEKIPVAKTMNETFNLKQDKFLWLSKHNFRVEDAISKWVHRNLDRTGM